MFLQGGEVTLGWETEPLGLALAWPRVTVINIMKSKLNTRCLCLPHNNP